MSQGAGIAAPTLDPGLGARHNRLGAIVKQLGRMVIAFSGGADSSFLLRASCETLGHESVLAVVASSPVQPPTDLEHARRVCDEIGCRLLIVPVNPLSWPEFVVNPPDRCYRCKHKLYTLLIEHVQQHGFELLADGTNQDDCSTDRPGLMAIRELGIATPLAAAGLTKADIRALSRHQGLSTWNRPSGSCLATRIPSNTPITHELLQLVADSEAYLHGLGFAGCRVRPAGDTVVVQLRRDDMVDVIDRSRCREVIGFFETSGFATVLLDLRGREAK